MNRLWYKISVLTTVFLVIALGSFAQRPRVLEKAKERMNQQGQQGQQNKQTSQVDSTIGFKHRDDLADSVNISYRYLDSLRLIRLDSSIDDFNRYFSIPAHYIYLGNNGSPSYPVLFTPLLKAGWDAGFHAFDVYRFTIDNTRFFKTTKAYSQIAYILASGKEQFIHILHTQNIKPNWNFGFEYRLISAPGYFQTQNTGHNNYRFFSNYQGKKKRYAAWFALNGNKISASENGGIQNDSLLDDPNRKDRSAVPVNLGGDVSNTFNPFSTNIATGHLYKEFNFFFRHSYDFGKRDSIRINDSTTEYLFYPRFRFQHSLMFQDYSFTFRDVLSNSISANADSLLFKKWYDTSVSISQGMNFIVRDKWKILSNDFTIRQFPETKNPAQFIEAGLRVENITGKFARDTGNFTNVVVHGEYRNKTRNRKWDATLNGELYTVGLNSGDYAVKAALTRFLNTKLGNISVGFQNINRSPSFIFDDRSSFNFKNPPRNKKENITMISARADNPVFSILFQNISINNYSYFKNYYQTDQFTSLINIAQVQAFKKWKLKKHLALYSDVILQQVTGNSPVKVPLFYTRQRLAFEGTFFKNLNLNTGLDVSYFTPYKMNNYSPIPGQFFPQDSVIHNLPVVHYYFNFRIKSFTGLVRLENLNTLTYNNGLKFLNNNFAAPHYPTPGFVFRLGIKWNFVN